MKLATTTIEVRTLGPGLVNVTAPVTRWLATRASGDGQLTLFIRHTSASLTIQENADPDVLKDLETFMRKLAPWEEGLYRHNTEGPDDMPAHIRAALTQTSITIPVIGGRAALGTWQGIYVWEHRAEPQQRQVVVQLLTA
jgi:secondary thiamine-phosphate synthase enzyme